MRRDAPPTSSLRDSGLRPLLFHGDESRRYRRRRQIFTAVWAAVTVGLTVPVVPALWSPRPLLLGLPASFAWVILCLVVVFAALVWLFRSEEV